MLDVLAVGWSSDGVVGGVNSLAFMEITCRSASESGYDFRAAMSCSSVRVGGGVVLSGGLSSLVEVPSGDGIVLYVVDCVLKLEKLEGRDKILCRGETISCHLRNVIEFLRKTTGKTLQKTF